MTIVEIKDAVLKNASLLTIAGKYVKLKRMGKDWFGLCPFHSERTPSFSVNEAKQIYKCFGCGVGGDVIDFVMKVEKKTFTEALDLIAAQEHIPIQWKSDNVPAYTKEAFDKLKTVESSTLLRTMCQYETNAFASWLIGLAGAERAALAIAAYYVGTAQYGGTVFWQVDQMQRVRTAVKIHYSEDGHRKKGVQPVRLFVQSKGYMPCLFGEHLLAGLTKEHLVGIVESEKTAVICSMWLPTLFGRPVIWLACSGANGLTEEKIWVLKGLDVVLVPDFSFPSRAQWGAVEMRKKMFVENGKEVYKIHKDGDIVPDYVSAKKRLQRYVKSILVLDDWKDIVDGSDIADLLVQMELPDEEHIQILPPDEFELPELPPEPFDL